VRHVHGGTFVPYIDYLDASPIGLVPDWLDVPATEPVDALYAPSHQKLCNQVGDRTRADFPVGNQRSFHDFFPPL
jgi:hypothetical protein